MECGDSSTRAALDQGQYLLPDGPIKQAFAELAAVKMLEHSERGQPDAARYKQLKEQAELLERKQLTEGNA